MPCLSKRTTELANSADPRLETLIRRYGPQYSEDYPEGVINLGIAGNTLMADWTLEHFKELPLTRADLTYGDAIAGSKRLYKGLGRLFEKYFHPITPVTEEHMVYGVGLSACIDQLVQKICDPGDTILISRPYYNGFDRDVSARSSARMVGVDIGNVDQTSPDTLDAFERTVKLMKHKNEPMPKAILLCNPHNPLGHVYPKETVLAYCRFAEKHDLHLLVDEIYALSLFENKDVLSRPTFQSVLSMDVWKEAQCNPARVHVLYGMSKDFGANGLRVGVIVSQHNPELIKSFAASAILMKLSSPSDALWSKILLDAELLSSYLIKAHAAASDALEFAVSWLDKMRIPYANPSAGHFIWCDFTGYLPSHDKSGKTLATKAEREWELCVRLLEACNVYIGPGSLYHAVEPGWCRLTFTVEKEYIALGFQRMEKLFQQLASS